MRKMPLWAASVALSLFAVPGTARAQPPATSADAATLAQVLRDEMAQLRRDFESRMTALEQRLATAEGGGASSAGAATTAGPVVGLIPVTSI